MMRINTIWGLQLEYRGRVCVECREHVYHAGAGGAQVSIQALLEWFQLRHPFQTYEDIKVL